MERQIVERKLTTILAADVVGYSALMRRDEAGTLAALKRNRRELLDPKATQYRGRTIKLMGDGALMEFGSVVDALLFAIEVQCAMRAQNAEVPDDQMIVYRVGINIGDIIVEGEDIYGDGVNIAARLEGLAEPGGICVSRTVFNHVRGKVDVTFDTMGEHQVKSIPEPVIAYRVALDEKADALVTPVAFASASYRMTRRLQLAALLIAVAVGSAGVLWWQPWAPGYAPAAIERMAFPLPDKPSVAVLPFDNLSDDPDQEYFADGLTDDLITDLSKISGLFVIARNSVFAYKDRADDVRAIADELGVRYVLHGSVRRAGEALRINAQLVDGTSGDNLWADRYERDYVDIFAIQDKVIASIVEALSVQLTEAEQTDVARLPTDSLEAYDYFLRGEKLTYNAERRSVEQALRLYQKAIALDPDFANAYAGYARVAVDVLSYSFADTLPSAVARKRAYAAAGKALALDPRLARSYSVLALLQMLDGEHEAALGSARKAVDLGPSDAEAHLNLGVVQVYAGRQEDALRTMETVVRLNPVPPAHVHDYYALALFMNGRYAEALAILRENPVPAKSELRLEMLASSNARLGRMDAAKAVVDEMLSIWPGYNLGWYRILFVHHEREEDRAARLEPLALAGMPEWPFGFEGDPAHRLDAAAIVELTERRTWTGEIVGQGPITQFNQDGGFILRGVDYQFTGHYRLVEDRLCLESPVILMGREDCGPIYRDPEGTGTYSYPTAYGLRRFVIDG